MKESVRRVKHTWIAGAAILMIAVAYFFLLGTSKFDEPGGNLVYNIQPFEDLDKIPTKYEEKTPIQPKVENPRALAVAGNKLYVAGQDAVAVFGDNDSEVSHFAIKGTPNCIAAEQDGVVYVGFPTKIDVLDATGAQKAEWTNFADRSYITAIASVGPDVFVADAGMREVSRFDKNGVLQNKFGAKDPSKDIVGLEVPSPYLDLAVNPDGELWVVNPGRLGLEQYGKDGTLVTSWYRPSVSKLEGFPGCCNPTHIAFNSKGELFTSEKGLLRIKSFEVTAGTFDGLVAGSQLFPEEHSARDLAVDSKDRILVLDGQRSEVRVFALKENQHGPGSQPA